MATTTAYGPYFHGGVPGLKPGDELLPPSATGNGEPRAWDADFIYVARMFAIACMHAARWPGGDVYSVAIEPCEGHDLSVPWETLWVPRAEVHRVIKRGHRGPAHYFASEAQPGAIPGSGGGVGDEVRCFEPPPPRTDLQTVQPIQRRSDG
ncbi:MAG TPA: hypothetical protein VFX44_08520 [Solirubrobacterales bacterium]|nr:hypothetical protein [Solirubrobacterales bacterium]